jgi:hypothetical protein
MLEAAPEAEVTGCLARHQDERDERGYAPPARNGLDRIRLVSFSPSRRSSTCGARNSTVRPPTFPPLHHVRRCSSPANALGVKLRAAKEPLHKSLTDEQKDGDLRQG